MAVMPHAMRTRLPQRPPPLNPAVKTHNKMVTHIPPATLLNMPPPDIGNPHITPRRGRRAMDDYLINPPTPGIKPSFLQNPGRVLLFHNNLFFHSNQCYLIIFPSQNYILRPGSCNLKNPGISQATKHPKIDPTTKPSAIHLCLTIVTKNKHL